MPLRIEPADLPTFVQRLSDIAALCPLLGDEGGWLVGGAVRDMFLGRPISDIDLAFPGDPTPLARAFARQTGGHWFFLDPQRNQSRVAIRDEDECRTIDFAPLRESDLTGDLRLRDFTINALAIPLKREGPGDLLSLPGALSDLENRILRGCSAGVFNDDPLRVLKGVRHAVTLGFAVEGETLESMRSAAPAIPGVAPERLRAELGKIFSAAPVASALDLMCSLDLAEPLFGADVRRFWDNGTRLAVRCEKLLETLGRDGGAPSLAGEEIEENLPRGALLKLAAFGRPLSSPEMIAWASRFKLSRRAGAILSALSHLDPAPAQEMESIPPGRPRAVWVAAFGRHPVEALIFLALLRQEEPSASARILRPFLHDFLRYSEDGRVPDLVDGRWMRQHLGITGPAIGEALVALRKEEAAGRVRNVAEGRKFLEFFVKKEIDNP